MTEIAEAEIRADIGACHVCGAAILLTWRGIVIYTCTGGKPCPCVRHPCPCHSSQK